MVKLNEEALEILENLEARLLALEIQEALAQRLLADIEQERISELTGF